MYVLRELGSYILRDTAEARQLKAPGPKPTNKQLKDARKGNGFATVPLTALIVGNGQTIGPQLA